MKLPADVLRRLDELDSLPWECDGITRLAAFILTESGVRHVAKAGKLIFDDEFEVPVHFWIELGGGLLVDYRARMWAGADPHVPHGVFAARDFPRAVYRDRSAQLAIPRVVFDVMTRSLAPRH